VETILHAAVESGHDTAPIHDLGQSSDSSCYHFHLFRLPLFRLGGTVLDGCDSARIRLAHASLRKQPTSPGTRTGSRRGLQPKHLVARTASTHSMGRELPPKPSLPSGLRMLQPALVADRSGLVCHTRFARGASREQCPRKPELIRLSITSLRGERCPFHADPAFS
jgi:hypothetical protein